MIIEREVFERTSTQVLVGAVLTSIFSGYMAAAGKTGSTQVLVGGSGGQFTGGAPVDVGVDLLRYDTKCFYVKNVGPTNRMNARLEATSIPAEQRQASDWELIDSTTFQDLAAGSAKTKQITGDSRRYWRVQGTSAACAAIVNVVAR